MLLSWTNYITLLVSVWFFLVTKCLIRSGTLAQPPPDIFKNQAPECYKYVDDMSLIDTLWSSATTFPDHTTYVLDDFEYRPKITYYPEILSNVPGARVITSSAIVVARFDIFNIYEMFHSLLNVYLVVKMFDLSDVVIVFNDTVGEDSLLDKEMFSAFSDTQIVIGDGTYSFTGGVYQAPVSYTSILSTKTKHGNLRGRGVDHHCKSTLLHDFTRFWIESKGITGPPRTRSKITWSSRGVHYRGSTRYMPSRSIVDERELVCELEKRVGAPIDVVDFGQLSAAESVAVMLDTDVLIGVHGAGLMWGAFMKPTTSSIIEIFGGDRGSNNRHYHNLASLAGLGYADIKHGLKTAPGRTLKWGGDQDFLEKLSKTLLEFL